MKQFIRNFKKQRTVGLLNICSLSLGIMVAVIVGLWAINELSFDRFHNNRGRMHRVILNFTQNGQHINLATHFKPLGEQAKDELPVIEDMCRTFITNSDITIENKLHIGVKIFVADSNFFSFFTFPLMEGDPKYVLSTPDRVVISETAAAKYFAGQDPIGQMLKYSGQYFAVSGVMKDMPKNSSLQADFVFPFFGWRIENTWGSNDDYVTFLLLQEGASTTALAESLTQISYRELDLFKNLGTTYSLEPLSNMHFGTKQMLYDPIVRGNKSLIMIFVLTALIILIISCINFTNLFVSTSFIRAKAIGIKKTVGAKWYQLMREFYFETACYVFLAIGAGLILATAIIPVFNDFAQASVSLDFTAPQIYIFLATLFVLVVLLAGSFPALVMTRFNPLETLKGKFKGKRMSLLQKSLVITQFAASITLLTVVSFMQKQVNYILSYDLGFNKEHVLYVHDRKNFDPDYRALEGVFFAEPSITNVAKKNRPTTEWSQGWSVKRVPADDSMPVLMEMCFVSANYFDFFDMKIINGENPFFLEGALETDVVINESAAHLLGYENPVGKMLEPEAGFSYNRLTIRGVVRNAYTKSLHQEVDPQIYFKYGSNNSTWDPITFFKVNGDPQRAISFVEQKWQEQESEYPFEYHFLDDAYRQLYTAEKNAGKVFSFAMAISVMITVAGLFAMAYYATQRRMKEVAIRKVYGASVKDIFMLLNKSFVLWVGIAFVIACPVAYYGLNKWLEGFAVKTTLSAWVFVLVGAIALLITLITTGYQTWKVATENPVNAIKND